MGFLFVAIFLALFMLGFPVVYAILLPSVAYILIEGLPFGLLTQRVDLRRQHGGLGVLLDGGLDQTSALRRQRDLLVAQGGDL